MGIEPKLHHKLLETLEKIPAMETPDGRSTLLVGIPREAWRRDLENKAVDLELILEQAAEVFIGEEETLQTWALLDVIESAISKVQKTSLGKKLRDLRRACVSQWRKEHAKEATTVYPAVDDSLSLHPSLSAQYADRGDVGEIMLVSDEMPAFIEGSLSAPDDVIVSPSVPFFATARAYVETIQQEVATAFQLFKDQPISYMEFSECTQAINCLRRSLESLASLAELLDPTKKVPASILKKRYTFIEDYRFLREQIEHLIERIDRGCTTDKEIRSKFLHIEDVLARFAPILFHSVQNET